MNLVIARYENYGSWTRGLLFFGKELTRERILSIDTGAYAWTPSEDNLCGSMKILVSSEEEARRLL